MKNIIQLVVLTLILAGAAFAQIEEPIEPITQGITFSGSETTGSRFNTKMDVPAGNTFALNGYNHQYSSILLTLSLDFDGPEDQANGNAIVGGTWNMAVYSKGGYVGSIFGDVTGGTVTWSGSGKKNTSAAFTVNGGTGDFDGYSNRIFPFYESETDLTNGNTDGFVTDLDF
jgi:hypothetical protein